MCQCRKSGWCPDPSCRQAPESQFGGCLLVNNLNLIKAINAQANHRGAGKGHMTHKAMPVITG